MSSQRSHRKNKAKMYETCKVCGKPKTIPTTMQKGVSRSDFDQDPYCSRTCCETDQATADAAANLNTDAERAALPPRRKTAA